MTEPRQLNLAEYAQEARREREQAERENKRRRARRAFIVFASDPERAGKENYKLVFATEAKTQAEAERKVRPLAGQQRRLAAYLASGKYKNELPEARWVA